MAAPGAALSSGSILRWCPAETTLQRNEMPVHSGESRHIRSRRDSGDPRAIHTVHVPFCMARGPETWNLSATAQLQPKPKATPWAGKGGVPQDPSPGRAERPPCPAALPSSLVQRHSFNESRNRQLLLPLGMQMWTVPGRVPATAVPTHSHPKPDPSGLRRSPTALLWLCPGTRSKVPAARLSGVLPAGSPARNCHRHRRPLLGK